MTRAARHIVRRVVLELDSSAPPADAPRHQARVAELCRRRLAGLLDRCLTEFSDPDTLYRIDRLECVILGIDLERLESEWTEKVEARLREALREALRQAGSNRVADVPFSGGPGARPSGGRDNAPVDASAFDLLTYFFRYGHLPWWAGATDRLAISTALQEIATTQPGSGLPERLFQITASDTAAQQRLFRHVDDSGLLAFCRRQAGAAELVAVLADIVTDASAQGPDWLRIRTRFWMEVWAVLQMPGTWQEGLETLLKILSADEVGGAPWSRMVVRLAEKYRFLSPFATGGVTSKGSAVNRSSPDDMPGQDRLQPDKRTVPQVHPTPGPSPIGRGDVVRSTTPLPTGEGPELIRERLPAHPPDFDTSDQIYLENAGLVLLAPFLHRLWEQLGWTAGKQFTSPETAWLAVQMLQYLADGQDDPPEYLLILPKILCGFAPDALYAPPRALEAAEKAEGEALLAAVLEHAPGLGLTTTGALRGSFLLRNGVLHSGGMHWLLHVEKETYDIVLQKVSWGFQVVKFPWMEVAVYVEWEV